MDDLITAQDYSGDSVFDAQSKDIITDYSEGALSKYNTFSNLSQDMYQDKKIVDAIANFMSTAVERDLNAKFHRSLNVLEQNGIITWEKFEKQNFCKYYNTGGIL